MMRSEFEAVIQQGLNSLNKNQIEYKDTDFVIGFIRNVPLIGTSYELHYKKHDLCCSVFQLNRYFLPIGYNQEIANLNRIETIDLATEDENQRKRLLISFYRLQVTQRVLLRYNSF